MEFFPQHKARFVGASIAAVFLLSSAAAALGSGSVDRLLATIGAESQTAVSICNVPGVGCGNGAINTENLSITVLSWSLPKYGGKGTLRVITRGYKTRIGVTAYCQYTNTVNGQTKGKTSNNDGEATITGLGPIMGPTQIKIKCTNYYNTYSSSDSTRITLDSGPAPTFTLEANPGTLNFSGSPVTSTITWGISPGFGCRLQGQGVLITRPEVQCPTNAQTMATFTTMGTYPYTLSFSPDNGATWIAGSSKNIRVVATDLCPALPGTQMTYPTGSSPVNSCTCPAGSTYNSATNTCPPPIDRCPLLPGAQATYPTGASPANSCTCPAGSTYNSTTNSCQATCSGAHQVGTPPNCTCEVGYSMQGGACVQNVCPGANEINWPACTCAAGYTRDATTEQCVRQPALDITVNGQSATRVRAGSSVAVSWSATGVQVGSCMVRTAAGTTVVSGQDSGTVDRTVTSQTIFRLSCVNDAGSAVMDEAIANIIPDYSEN